MSTNKQPKPSRPSDADLRGDPGIGRSKGTAGADAYDLGENTVEGDVLNDTHPERRRRPAAARPHQSLRETMTGRKTHEQQRRIIERRENTRNADPDFDPRPDLKRSDAGAPPPPPAGGRHAELEDPDSYPPPRGTHQESEHHKRPADQ